MNEEMRDQGTAQPDWLGRLADWTHKVSGKLEATLQSLIEREVALTPQPPRFFTASDVEEMFPEGPVLLDIRFTGAEIGDWNFLCPRSLAATIGDLAMMGQGSVPFDETVHPSGLGEVWGQTIAALEEDLKTLVHSEVTIEMPLVSLDPTPFLKELRNHPVVRWGIDIKGVGTGFILHGFSPDFGAFLKPLAKPASRPKTRAAAPEAKPRAAAPAPLVRAASFEEFQEPSAPGEGREPRNLDMLLDINLPITIELGRTTMLIRDVLQLGPGSVIELDKLSGEPVDLYVNDKKFAKGEVVVIEENFGVRITELIRLDERVKALGG